MQIQIFSYLGYTSTFLNPLADADYIYVDSAGSTLTNVNYTDTVYVPSSIAITLVSVSNYSSDTSYWLNDITISNVISNSQLNTSEYFFCSLVGTSTQNCQFTTTKGNQIPSWISVDLANSQLVINAPNLTASTNYTFTLEETSAENLSSYYRIVNVQVVTWNISNWIM